MFSKAKAAKLIRELVDLYLTMGAATEHEVSECMDGSIIIGLYRLNRGYIIIVLTNEHTDQSDLFRIEYRYGYLF